MRFSKSIDFVHSKKLTFVGGHAVVVVLMPGWHLLQIQLHERNLKTCIQMFKVAQEPECWTWSKILSRWTSCWPSLWPMATDSKPAR